MSLDAILKHKLMHFEVLLQFSYQNKQLDDHFVAQLRPHRNLMHLFFCINGQAKTGINGQAKTGVLVMAAFKFSSAN